LNSQEIQGKFIRNENELLEIFFNSQDNSVSKVMGYGMVELGLIPAGDRISLGHCQNL
jgi:hypothetical protein